MCAAPARHRATQAGPARHARKGSTNSAQQIGRVGALAVSLGVGFAIAQAAQPAYADTGASTSSESASSTGPSAAADNSTKARPSGDRKRGPRSVADPEGAHSPVASEEVVSPAGASTGRKVRPRLQIDRPVRAEKALADVAPVSPNAPAAGESVTGGSVTEEAVTEIPVIESPVAAAPKAPTVPDTKPAVGAVIPKMTAAVSAPGAQSATPPNPLDLIVNTMMAWVARQVSHTFVNRTPIAGPVVYEQNALGQVYIDLNASDPNGDVLKFDIVQPEKGWVYRDLITGKFVYTPWALVTGQPLVDNFTIVIRDDTEHLPGVFGQIQTLVETVTRFLGVAQADNLTVSIPVTVDPVYQAPPLVTPIVGGGYKIGDEPAHIVSTVDIVDGDSTGLKRVVIKIATLSRPGDLLSYNAPANSPIVGAWDEGTLTLTLSGSATLAEYEQAIKSVTFSATQGAALVRGITISATDQDDVDNIAPGFVTVAVWAPTKLPPLVTPIMGGGFTIGGSPAKIVSAVDIVDADSGKLSKLTVKIVTFAQTGDVLNYLAPSGNPVTATWNAADYTLTLTGAGTLAQYEEALKAVTFTGTQGAALVRGLSISAVDEHGVSNVAPGFVTLGVSSPTRYVPLVTAIGGRSYTIGNSPIKPVAGIDIVDADSSHLQRVTMSVTAFGKAGDTLLFNGVADGPITASYDASTRVLTLSGVATKQQYEDALKAVTFSATDGAWTTRTILIVATDTDGVKSAAGALTVSVW